MKGGTGGGNRGRGGGRDGGRDGERRMSCKHMHCSWCMKESAEAARQQLVASTVDRTASHCSAMKNPRDKSQSIKQTCAHCCLQNGAE